MSNRFAISADKEGESLQGVGPHKDSGFLSFLLQDENKGLQVEIAPGKWIDVEPKTGALVVNIGELLELATNGYLRATVYRVVSPPAERKQLSIAFFTGGAIECGRTDLPAVATLISQWTVFFFSVLYGQKPRPGI